MIVVAFFHIMTVINGKAITQKWEKYIEDGGVCDEELTRAIAPYIKWIMITMTIGRFLMVILSMWYPRITRIYIYYHWVY